MYIPCENFALRGRTPFWRINGVDYIVSNLPPAYTHSLFGLRINVITRDLDGTSFQCLLPSENSFSVQLSTIGILTVTEINGI